MLRSKLKLLTTRKNSIIYYRFNNQANKKGGSNFRLFYLNNYLTYAGIGGNDQGAR